VDGKEHQETRAQVIPDRTGKRFSELELRNGFGKATISDLSRHVRPMLNDSR
jgi:hypothetical protein